MKPHATTSGAATPGANVPQIVRFLGDVEEEFSASRFRAYVSEVRPMMPAEAYEHLEAACRQIAEARASVRRAVKRLTH